MNKSVNQTSPLPRKLCIESKNVVNASMRLEEILFISPISSSHSKNFYFFIQKNVYNMYDNHYVKKKY